MCPIRRGLLGSVAVAVMVLGSAVPVGAFNPPVDTAGPLTVRIEGPEEVRRLDAPIAVRVVLENKGESAVKGTVELKLIDRWRAEPAGAVSFSVDGKGSTGLDFRIVGGEGTYSALYPIHALAKFEAGGQSLVAHPILIFETKLAEGGAAEKQGHFPVSGSAMGGADGLTWQPFSVAANSRLALWQLPAFRAVVAVFGEAPLVSPIGWQGAEARSHGVIDFRSVSLEDKVREAIVIHPPWYEGHVGTELVEFPLQLADAKPIVLRFSNAMQQDGQSDGVTFRVHVAPFDAPAGQLGEVVFERHVADKTWQPAEADLSRFAGKAVRLQLESHPGPAKNTGWDLSYWAEPTLVVGAPPEAPAFPPKGDEGSLALGKIRRGEREYEVRLWPGQRGLLDSTIGFSAGGKRLLFHGFEVRVLGAQLEDPSAPIVLEQAVEEPTAAGRQVRHRFRSLWGSLDLVGRVWIDEGVLRAKFSLENVPAPRPWFVVRLEDVAAGPWSETASQIYAGTGNVIRRPKAFQLGFDGHRLSTSFVGMDFESGLSLVQGCDAPPTRLDVRPDARHCSIHTSGECTFSLIPTDDVWEGARAWHDANGLKPAGGVDAAAGRFVFDLWGGRYAESAAALRRSFRYGLTDAMVVWHNWQRWGYDYRLPEICPPNPQLGTTDEMRALAATCKEAGVPFAPHDNYIDFYPDADGFSYEKTIAFHSKYSPIRAWLNQGRGAQSYRYRADAIARFLRPNVDWIREHLAPTAYFIDVWSSAPPYDYWTADGSYSSKDYTLKVWRDEFAWIREQLGGKAPQISESGHDQLIGFLDGAQTNHLRVDEPIAGNYGWAVWSIPCEDAERTPWFDAAHHDRFILHGAGYSPRYEGGLDGRMHGIYSDDYLTTEVLTGHPAMVPSPFGLDVVRKYWLTAELMRALALRRIESVEYVENDLHRQHVRWSGGGEVWANRGKEDWQVAGVVLPPFGFLARVPAEKGTVEAAVCRRGGMTTEWASSPSQFYVNGRHAVLGNPKAMPIDFGAVTTFGACRFSHKGDALVVTPLPLPKGPGYSVAIRWADLPWKLPEPTQVVAIDEAGKVLSTQAVERSDNAIKLLCEPGVFQYRLVRQ